MHGREKAEQGSIQREGEGREGRRQGDGEGRSREEARRLLMEGKAREKRR
jgi:hypothetical protein